MENDEHKDKDTYENEKLYTCAETGLIRGKFMKIITSKGFDYFIMIIILINCITMAVEPDSKTKSKNENKGIDVYKIMEYTFQIIYTIEMVMKIIALSLYQGENGYLRDGWNVMDFIIVMLSWGTMWMGSGGSISSVRSVRALRTLRTLSALP